MSDVAAILLAVPGVSDLRLQAVAPLLGAAMLIAVWRAMEQGAQSRSEATQEAVNRSRTVLGALHIR